MSVPNFPVIVVHLDDGHGQVVCTGDELSEVDERYDHVPRYACVACHRFVYGGPLTEPRAVTLEPGETVKLPGTPDA